MRQDFANLVEVVEEPSQVVEEESEPMRQPIEDETEIGKEPEAKTVEDTEIIDSETNQHTINVNFFFHVNYLSFYVCDRLK